MFEMFGEKNFYVRSNVLLTFCIKFSNIQLYS